MRKKINLFLDKLLESRRDGLAAIQEKHDKEFLAPFNTVADELRAKGTRIIETPKQAKKLYPQYSKPKYERYQATKLMIEVHANGVVHTRIMNLDQEPSDCGGALIEATVEPIDVLLSRRKRRSSSMA